MLDKKLMTVKDFMAITGISRSFAYKLIKTGRINSVSLGRKILIPVSAVEQLLTRP